MKPFWRKMLRMNFERTRLCGRRWRILVRMTLTAKFVIVKPHVCASELTQHECIHYYVVSCESWINSRCVVVAVKHPREYSANFPMNFSAIDRMYRVRCAFFVLHNERTTFARFRHTSHAIAYPLLHLFYSRTNAPRMCMYLRVGCCSRDGCVQPRTAANAISMNNARIHLDIWTFLLIWLHRCDVSVRRSRAPSPRKSNFHEPDSRHNSSQFVWLIYVQPNYMPSLKNNLEALFYSLSRPPFGVCVCLRICPQVAAVVTVYSISTDNDLCCILSAHWEKCEALYPFDRDSVAGVSVGYSGFNQGLWKIRILIIW